MWFVSNYLESERLARERDDQANDDYRESENAVLLIEYLLGDSEGVPMIDEDRLALMIFLVDFRGFLLQPWGDAIRQAKDERDRVWAVQESRRRAKQLLALWAASPTHATPASLKGDPHDESQA